MSYIKTAIAAGHWGRVTGVIGVGLLLGLVLAYGLSQLYEVGSLEFVLAIVSFSFLADVVLAWENQRAIAKGRVRLWNEVVGEIAVVSERFAREGDKYRGKVKLGLERWTAISDAPLSEGERVRISGRNRLLLSVERRP